MLKLEIFILKLFPVDALSSSAIAFGEVAALDHKLLDTEYCGMKLDTLMTRWNFEPL